MKGCDGIGMKAFVVFMGEWSMALRGCIPRCCGGIA